MVTSAEVLAGGALLGDALGGGVRAIGQVHRAVAGRVFDALPPSAAPVRVVHHLMTSSTYGTVRLAHLAIPRLGARAASAVAGPGRPALGASPTGRLALGTLNGLWATASSRGTPPWPRRWR